MLIMELAQCSLHDVLHTKHSGIPDVILSVKSMQWKVDVAADVV